MSDTKRNLEWCRKYLGDAGKEMTDAQIIQYRDFIEQMINSVFNEVLYGKKSA